MFPTIASLQSFINTYVNTNGTDSITGANLNLALSGITEFLGTAGGPTIGSHNVNIATSGATISNTIIPLSFTPISTVVQAAVPFTGLSNFVIVLSSTPTTNGIIVYYESSIASTPFNVTFSYLAI